ncbi:MAG: hypothetical protein CME70_19210 [Halobacteriovorax sp.]|nr:hypothetical protein [Halobacteriovorax sp.]|tara:strand:+ start:991 stop:1779 length:789 start_codon:yes stop_codon:yes gene_type:complete
MRISRKKLEKIIREAMSGFAPTAQEEAEKINAQAGPGLYGMTLVTDQSFWEERGITTGEELAFEILSQTYSDAFKSLHGIRPRWARFETVAQVQAAIDDLDREAEAMAEDDAFNAEREAEWEKERQELAALQVPGLDLDYEKVPQRSGMGKRLKTKSAQRQWENKAMNITKSRLRQIIREEILKENPEDEASADAGAESKTAAGKKADIALDKSGVQPLLVAIDAANNKDSVKEILSQLFAELGENGRKYLKQALADIYREL